MTQPDHPTRQRIQTVAQPLFAALGYEGVSLRAIAGKAEVQLGLIPYHFGSKLGLYHAIWHDWMSQIPADLLLAEQSAASDAPLDRQIRAAVQAFFAGPRNILRQPQGACFIAIMVREANSPTAGERGLLDEFIHPNGKIIRERLRSLLPDLAPDRFAAGMKMLVSALEIVIEREQVTDYEATFATLADFLVGGWMSLTRPTA